MSIRDIQASHPKAASPTTMGSTLNEQPHRENEPENELFSQVASFPYDDFPQPDSLESQMSPPSGQPPAYDADDSATEYSDESDTDMLPPSSAPRTSSGSPRGLPSPTPADLETQDSYCSIPPELSEFREMFQGEGSYPPDFPLSLRFVRVSAPPAHIVLIYFAVKRLADDHNLIYNTHFQDTSHGYTTTSLSFTPHIWTLALQILIPRNPFEYITLVF